MHYKKVAGKHLDLPSFYYEGRRKDKNEFYTAITDWQNKMITQGKGGYFIGSRARQIMRRHAFNTPANLSKYIIHVTSFHQDMWFYDFYHGDD